MLGKSWDQDSLILHDGARRIQLCHSREAHELAKQGTTEPLAVSEALWLFEGLWHRNLLALRVFAQRLQLGSGVPLSAWDDYQLKEAIANRIKRGDLTMFGTSTGESKRAAQPAQRGAAPLVTATLRRPAATARAPLQRPQPAPAVPAHSRPDVSRKLDLQPAIRAGSPADLSSKIDVNPGQAATVVAPGSVPSANPAPPLPIAAAKDEPASFFAIRLLDEAGKRIDDVVAFDLDANGGHNPLTASRHRARLDGVKPGAGRLTLSDMAAVRQLLKDRNVRPDPAALPSGRLVKTLLVGPGAEPIVIQSDAEHTIVLRIPPKVVTAVEVQDGMFRLDSAVVLPEAETPSADAHEALTATGVFSTALHFAAGNPTKKLLLAGHTDTSGSESHNQLLSEERAACALACLEGDRDTFGDVCHKRHLIADCKQVLSWAARAFDFSCDPGKIDNMEFTGVEPIKAFQRDYNAARAELGVPGNEALKVDGSMGPKSWRAVFDCYEAALAAEISDAATVSGRLQDLASLRKALRFVDDGKKREGFGESHPIDQIGRDKVRSQANRRVEMLFFDEGDEPDLSQAPADSTIFVPEVFKRIPIDANTPGQITLVISDHKGVPVAGAQVVAVGPSALAPALADVGGLATLAPVRPGSYRVTATKNGHWFDRIRVRVAPGSNGRLVSRG